MTQIQAPSLPLRKRLAGALYQPHDIAGLAVFRILFGLMMFAGTLRFIANGWIQKLYVEPDFFFKYWGFHWVEVWPEWGLYLHFSALAVLALFIALGFCYRLSIVMFFLGFAYAELMDVSNYLNHYYFITLLSGLMMFMPLHRAWSIDAWLRPRIRAVSLPAWNTYLLRFQVAMLYFYAGLAKLEPDWLLYAQPLNIWLTSKTDTPIIGLWLDELWVHYAMSWGAFLFDTFIIAFMLNRRTRPFAFCVILLFHFLTHVFFNIGMFPIIMVVSVLVFFSPSWPRRWLSRFPRLAIPEASIPPLSWGRGLAVTAFASYCAFQFLFPLRHLLYPGTVLWNEEGMRFSWKVMLREKVGLVTYDLHDPATGRRWSVSPGDYLNNYQEREFATQPDLILQLAHHIADDYARRGYENLEVRTTAWVSLNGRPARLLIDPTVDLAKQSDSFARKDWIQPPPKESPIQLIPVGTLTHRWVMQH
jgi:vitamin K-dependent gamma-carboxylase